MSRNLLSKLNTGIALFMLVFAFYYFFIDAISIPLSVIFSFLTVMFFLLGVHYFKNRKKTMGYLYIVVAVFLIFVVLNDFFAML
ncbi:DUF3953 domain-containing protein [Virgibacillus sp. SK37]|uniref:DUF3953 domain-containing protein n=1 Tax=Virgibacillus sp. SK37 TaxID=403957 RepID=UPI0004D0CBFB|nr:DUF3953 domain-containing protein [Virgibacillus sp. SK37]AIF45339.1 hypothetical protein X953_07385 [Virgibacillus sp. SK37]